LHEGVHTPDTQLFEPLIGWHTTPQAPQLEALELTLTSQPSALTRLQLAQPPAHEEIWQLPEAHDDVAFARLQPAPHAPQLVDELSCVSHPFFGLPSQLPNPEEHTGLHTPFTHEVEPFAFVHTEPHAPQFATLVSRFVSQPFTRLPSQLPAPPLHTGLHAPFTHEVEPFAFVQATPHAPQSPASFCRLLSQPLDALPSQFPKLALQLGVHVPFTHEVVPFGFVHAELHAPQLLVLDDTCVSHPLFGLPSQLAHPDAHVGVHAPLWQDVVPLTFEQARAHCPQFDKLVFKLVSQPFSRLPSQLPNPPLHEGRHVPFAHEVVPLALVQAVLHAPQFDVLVPRFASQPFWTLLSQLA